MCPQSSSSSTTYTSGRGPEPDAYELVAIDDNGRPDFHLLQNFRAEAARIHYYIFDLLCCNDRDLTRLPLIERRALLKSLVMIEDKRIRISDYVEAGATELLAAVREQHLEGIVGKRKDSLYQPGKRSGAWIKYRVNRGQELVIGGYTPGPHGIDAIIVGYQGDAGLNYVARIRNGFVPASRRQVFEKLRPLASANGCQRTHRGGVSQTIDDGPAPIRTVYLPRPHTVTKAGARPA